MTEGKNRQWILNARPAGKLTGEEFLWNEAPIPRPSDGQVLIRTLWLSVDPAQRIWMVSRFLQTGGSARGCHAVLCRRAGDRIA